MPVSAVMTPRVSITLATPKSAILTMPLSSISRFAAFRSLQTVVCAPSGTDQKLLPNACCPDVTRLAAHR